MTTPTLTPYLMPLSSRWITVEMWRSNLSRFLVSQQSGCSDWYTRRKLSSSTISSYRVLYCRSSLLKDRSIDTLSSCCKKARRLNGCRRLNGVALWRRVQQEEDQDHAPLFAAPTHLMLDLAILCHHPVAEGAASEEKGGGEEEEKAEQASHAAIMRPWHVSCIRTMGVADGGVPVMTS